jgi:erythromycin esterase-like protein
MIRGLLLALMLTTLPAAAPAQAGDPAMDAAVRDLCHRQVALLGEASHGDGATFAFKAALIRRLVTQCGYDAVLFESSHYDFVELMRRLREREEATPAMLSSAIGGIWNRYAELTPLLQFLFERARAGRLTLGGLDDQLGSAGAFFSNDEMTIRLTASLPAESRNRCRGLLHDRIFSGTPTGPAEKAEMRTVSLACTTAMAAAARNGDEAQLVANMARQIGRDGADPQAYARGRDESMFRNLRWYRARLGPRARFIIWAHNDHIAHDATYSRSFPQGGNLGAYIQQAYGRRAFALGFSAHGGTWQRPPFMREPEAIPPAPAGSLEALALAGSRADSVYRNRSWFARLGQVPGRPDHYQFAPFDWSRAFDGMIILRAERAPRFAP